MSRLTPSSRRRPSFSARWVLVATGMCGAQCIGTEADNPFAEQPAEVTPCKGKDDYVAFRHALWSAHGPGSRVSEQFAQLGQALTATSEVPVWLECVDWTLDGEGVLSLQVFNFRGGCGVSWEGTAWVSEEEALRLELQNANPGCAIAGCGNCTYDARTTFELADGAVHDMPFTLARLPCDGSNGRDSAWMLPLSTEPAGTRCTLADTWGAAKAQSNGGGRSDNLYASCTLDEVPDPDAYPEPLTECGEGLTCVDDRCLLACGGDADCPLSGALRCQDGYCRLPLP